MCITFKIAPDTMFNHSELKIHRTSLKMTKICKDRMSVSGAQPCSCRTLVRAGRYYTLIGPFVLEGGAQQTVNWKCN